MSKVKGQEGDLKGPANGGDLGEVLELNVWGVKCVCKSVCSATAASPNHKV